MSTPGQQRGFPPTTAGDFAPEETGRAPAFPGRSRARQASLPSADCLGVRHKITCILVFALFVTKLCGESAPLFRKRVSEVQLTLVATDQNDRPLMTLAPTDITVLEDGQAIPQFELRPAADLPLRVAVVIDLSDSNQKAWTAVKNTLVGSLGGWMRPRDQMLVVEFNSKTVMQTPVKDPTQLESALERPDSNHGLTALYDTIYQVCDHPIFKRADEPVRSALILFSDGEDDLSLHGLGDAIARAELNGVSLYTISAHNPRQASAGDTVLHELASATGGRDFVVGDAVRLQQSLSAIRDELRNSYFLYYRPLNDQQARGFRRVRVVPARAGGARIRSRAGYFTQR